MEKQVLSIEKMMHLQELGLDISKASMCWMVFDIEDSPTQLWTHNKDCYDFEFANPIPTFTLQDILELLPYKTVASYLHIGRKSFSGDILFYVEYSNFGGYAVSHFRSESLLDAAYEMLVWVVENGYIKSK